MTKKLLIILILLSFAVPVLAQQALVANNVQQAIDSGDISQIDTQISRMDQAIEATNNRIGECGVRTRCTPQDLQDLYVSGATYIEYKLELLQAKDSLVDEDLSEQIAQVRTDQSRWLEKAQGAGKAASIAADKAAKSCGLLNFGVCFTDALRWLTTFSLIFFGWILSLAGGVLDLAIKFSIIDLGTYLSSTSSVGKFWQGTRDISNMVFIFFVLYIAFKMVLGLATREAKQMLISIVIVAILINFSGMITGAIIDASNIASLEFYQRIKNERVTVNQNGGKVVIGDGIGGAVMKGLKLPQYFATASGSAAAAGLSNTQALVSYFGAIITILTAAFVFCATALLFIRRSVVLVIAYTIAPFAFAMAALPGTRSFFKQWLSEVLRESFFAPIMIFFFYFIVELTRDLAGFLGPSSGSAAIDTASAIFLYLRIIAVLVAALLLANMMGIKGSQGALAMGARMRNWGLRTLHAGTTRPLGRSVKHQFQRWGSKIEAYGSKTDEEGREVGKFQRALGWIPFARAGLHAGTKSYKKDVMEKAGEFKELRTSQMKRRLRTGWITPTTRAALIKAIQEKVDLDELTREEIQQGVALLKQAGLSTKNIERARPDAGKTQYAMENVIVGMKANELSEEKLHREVMRSQGVVLNQDGSVRVDDKGKPIEVHTAVVDAFIKNTSGGMFYNLAKRGDDVSTKLQEELIRRANEWGAKPENNMNWGKGIRSSAQIVGYLESLMKEVETEAEKLERKKKEEPTKFTKDEGAWLESLEERKRRIGGHAAFVTQAGTYARDLGLDQYAKAGFQPPESSYKKKEGDTK